jgi:hypothetical protein
MLMVKLLRHGGRINRPIVINKYGEQTGGGLLLCGNEPSGFIKFGKCIDFPRTLLQGVSHYLVSQLVG